MRRVLTTLALMAALAGAPSRIVAATWHEVFAADHDTTVFFGADGTLLRAPFHLAERETLWAPSGGQRLVRVRVSPDGRRVAWLTRAQDRDTTRLWVDGLAVTGPRVRYFALEPDQYGRVHSESAIPTTEDREARGGRLLRTGSLLRRLVSNTLEWTPDSRAVVFGYDDGVAAVPADGGPGFGVSRALAVEMAALEPAPIYLVDAIVLREQLRYFHPENRGVHPSDLSVPLEDGRPVYDALELAHPDVLIGRGASSDTYLLYPLAHRWRVFGAAGLRPSSLRAASPGTVWWASAGVIRAVRTHDPAPTEEVRSAAAVVWLGYDEAHRALVWAAGRDVLRRPEEGGATVVALRTRGPIESVLPSRTGRSIGLVAGDSLIVWSPQDDAARSLWRSDLNPGTLFEGPAGEVLVATQGARGALPRLARADFAAGRLVPLEVPRIKGGVFTPTSNGTWLILSAPASRPPAVLDVYEVASGKWTRVDNPGITGWEPLEPR